MSLLSAFVLCPGFTALDSIIGFVAALVVLVAVASAPRGDPADGGGGQTGEPGESLGWRPGSRP